MKQKIRELIVVEGKNDTARLKRFFDCDTIETGGLSLDEETLAYIALANEKRGVIIFTDPDSPGNRIRDKINKAVPGCRNAFVDKKEARTEKKVGIEHAEEDVLRESLEHLITYTDTVQENISVADFYEAGLLGKEDSAQKRETIGNLLHIGFANAKTLRHRMNCLGITKEELMKLVNEV